MTVSRRLVEPRPGNGTDGDRARMVFFQYMQIRRILQSIDLIEDQQRRFAIAAQLLEHAVDGGDLLLGLGIAGIDDVQQEPGLTGFLQGRLERGDEMVRQIADEADRVAQQHPAPIRQPPLPGARVERGKELVLGQDAGAGQGVHQRAFAGIGVADQGDGMLLASGWRRRVPCGLGPRRADV